MKKYLTILSLAAILGLTGHLESHILTLALWWNQTRQNTKNAATIQHST